MLRLLFSFCFFIFSLSTIAAQAQSESENITLQELKEGGLIIYMRHATTNHSQKDAPLSEFNENDCSTQRNLNEKGRQQARQIQQALKQKNIPIGDVYSSPYCRCKETAELAFQKFEIKDYLHFAIGLQKEEKTKITKKLKSRLMTPVPKGENLVLVSHTANLIEAADIWPKPEGVSYIFRPLGNSFELIGKLQSEDWESLK